AGDPVKSDFVIPADALVDGENTIAVALYQDRDSSSDAYFDLPSLTLTPIPPSSEGGVVIAPPSRVILTPTDSPTNSQSFSWLAGDASHEVGQVEITPAAGGDIRTIDARNVGTVNSNEKPHFSATVTGLSPATSYRYRVGLPES